MLTKQDLGAIGSLIDKKLTPVRKDIGKIDKKLDKTIDFFDKREVKIINNVRSIQKFLDLPVMDLN